VKIKLLQWNIWYKEDIANVVELIKQLGPDVVCLQELGIKSTSNPDIADTAEYVAEKTGMYFYHEEAQRWDNDTEMDAICNGIFSKYPISRTFTKHVQEPTKECIDYAHEGRIYIECDLKIGNEIITIGTAHLSYVPWFKITDEKKLEVDNLLAHIKDKKYVFSGDLNSTPNSYTIEHLSKKLSHCGPDYSENTWTTKPFEHGGFKEDKLSWRLDYVFASRDMNCVDSEVINTDYSDHLPILTTFELNE